MRSTIQTVTQECLLACADAHHIAGLLMVEKIEPLAMEDAALQLERTARQIKKLIKEKGGSRHARS